jgi:hypothetical protein
MDAMTSGLSILPRAPIDPQFARKGNATKRKAQIGRIQYIGFLHAAAATGAAAGSAAAAGGAFADDLPSTRMSYPYPPPGAPGTFPGPS